MKWTRRVLRGAGVVVGVAVTSGLIAVLRGLLVVPSLSPVYLLVVILFAVTWGWWPALLAAVLAVLAYNFFFVEPIHTFTIFDPQEWISLLIFLFVASVTSTLAARERARREEARQRAEEAALLYAVSRALAGQPLEPALGAVAELLRDALQLRGCTILLADEQGRLGPGAEAGQPASSQAPAEWLLAPERGAEANAPARRWIAVRRPGARGASAAHQVPLRVGGRQVGVLRLAGEPGGLSEEAGRLLGSVADQLATAIERERLRQAATEAELLRRTYELRSALLSSVSHDLRTPLAAIKASAGSLLQHDVPWSQDDRDGFAETIDHEADRLDRLVRSLLDMSRIEGGALRPRRDWYDPAELVREVTARLRPRLADHPLRLELADDLPPVQIDYLMIGQVLANLLENAAHYTPPGTPVEVVLDAADGTLRTCVVDHGAGVPAGAAERIFEKFQRAAGPGGPPGSGLGLAVSRGFVEAHGGRLEHRLTPGGGATFCFSLPLTGPTPAGQRARALGVERQP